MPRQVQLHMNAINQLLSICSRKNIYLSSNLKRAIFWFVLPLSPPPPESLPNLTPYRSDLNASILTGSTRIVSHTTFSELHWRRDSFSPGLFTLPPGFQALSQSHLFSEEFVEVLKDIAALQCIRDSNFFGKEDVIAMAQVDNQQASIQSRLVSFTPDCAPVLECCQLAAYICSTMLRCRIWRGSVVPVSSPSSSIIPQISCKTARIVLFLSESVNANFEQC